MNYIFVKNFKFRKKASIKYWLLIFLIQLFFSNCIYSNQKFIDNKYKGAGINIPLNDWKYDAIDRLILAFEINIVTCTKPYSLIEMALIVVEIEKKISSGYTLTGYYKRLLIDLETDLKEELNILKQDINELNKIYLNNLALTSIYNSSDKNYSENNFGDKYGKNLNLRLDISGFAVYKRIALDIWLKTIYNNQDNNGFREEIWQGYSKIFFGKNIELEYGRDSLWWGPGYHGALLLSNNIKPWEQLKINNRLPVDLKILGPSKFTFFIGKISKQEIKYTDQNKSIDKIVSPNITGLRTNFSPALWCEIGFSMSTIFIERKDGLSPQNAITLIFPFSKPDDEPVTVKETYKGPITDRIASLDISFKIPNKFISPIGLSGMKLYWEYGAEDFENIDKLYRFPWFGAASDIIGMYVDSGTTDFRIEYTTMKSTDRVYWYSHSQFKDGYRHYGQIIGHHLGGWGDDIFFRITHPIKNNLKFIFDFDQEKLAREINGEFNLKTHYNIGLNYKLSDETELIFNNRFEILKPFDSDSSNETISQLGVKYSF